jgi:hypothetical protein
MTDDENSYLSIRGSNCRQARTQWRSFRSPSRSIIVTSSSPQRFSRITIGQRADALNTAGAPSRSLSKTLHRRPSALPASSEPMAWAGEFSLRSAQRHPPVRVSPPEALRLLTVRLPCLLLNAQPPLCHHCPRDCPTSPAPTEPVPETGKRQFRVSPWG